MDVSTRLSVLSTTEQPDNSPAEKSLSTYFRECSVEAREFLCDLIRRMDGRSKEEAARRIIEWRI